MNMIVFKDKKYCFVEFFNPQNGFLMRTDSTETGMNPVMRSFPELLDVGVMGHCESSNMGLCKNAGVDCYQMASRSKRKNMWIDDYCKIVDESEGKVFQIALGGAGDPNKHENFEDILKYTRHHNIVPNYTTSGYNLTEQEVLKTKDYCGSVAVSFYTRLIDGTESNAQTIMAIKTFLSAGCRTNVHYVVSTDTIDEVVHRIENNIFPEGIAAVVLLLYKPSGFGVKEKTLSYHQSGKLRKLVEAVESLEHPYEIGFDTCFTPALLSYSKKIDFASIDFCEAARFSMYIDCEMNAFPCSFDSCNREYIFPMKNKKIIEAWNSDQFSAFRRNQEKRCPVCSHNALCLGGCSLFDEVNLCGKRM